MLGKWSINWPAEVKSILSASERPFYLYDPCNCTYWSLSVQTYFHMVEFVYKFPILLWGEKGWIHSSLWPELQRGGFFFSSQFNLTFLTWQKKYYMNEFQDSLAVWWCYLVRLQHCTLKEWKPDYTLLSNDSCCKTLCHLFFLCLKCNRVCCSQPPL